MIKRLLLLGLLSGCGAWDPVLAPPTWQAFSRDGVVEAMQYVAEHRFKRLDLNQDGFVDRFKEWDGWDDDFLMGDQNRDNKLTRGEYRDLLTGDIAVEQFQSLCWQMFSRWDKNQNLRLSESEWQQAGHVFSDRTALGDLAWRPFDRDQDGALDPSEFEDAFSHHWARHGTD